MRGTGAMGKNNKKYYAVKKGFVPGIYLSWGECQQNINGFPGAEFHGFATMEEAKAFLHGIDTTEQEKCVSRIYTEAEAIAYVDGSFNPETNEYAYGVVLFFDGGEERFAEKFSNDEMASMHNVAGEIKGSMRVMRFCIENNIKSVDVFYDYEGIEKWCTGAWQPKKPGTKDYKKYYNSVKDKVAVNFVKVKSHSGDTYNDIADSLAKAALGLDEIVNTISTRDNGVIANGIKQEDLLQVIELLKEDFEDLIVAEGEIPYGVQYELAIRKPTKQKIFINYYETKQKIWVNGRKEDLFNQFVLFIVELIDTDEISNFLNTVHNLSVDKDVIETQFEKCFPNSFDKLPHEINNYLHQAVYNLQIAGEVYVANFLVEPAIRPLEGILKLAFLDNGFPIRQEDKDYDTFFIFKEKENGYVVKEQYIKDHHSIDLLKYLCKCYAFYCNNRHTLFHWDNPTKKPDTTRILKTTAEAQVIIRDAIALIDEYFTIH